MPVPADVAAHLDDTTLVLFTKSDLVPKGSAEEALAMAKRLLLPHGVQTAWCGSVVHPEGMKTFMEGFVNALKHRLVAVSCGYW